MIIEAKADEGWTFAGYKDRSTGAIVSNNARYELDVKEELDLVALFTVESKDIVAEHTFRYYIDNYAILLSFM